MGIKVDSVKNEEKSSNKTKKRVTIDPSKQIYEKTSENTKQKKGIAPNTKQTQKTNQILSKRRMLKITLNRSNTTNILQTTRNVDLLIQIPNKIRRSRRNIVNNKTEDTKNYKDSRTKQRKK